MLICLLHGLKISHDGFPEKRLAHGVAGRVEGVVLYGAVLEGGRFHAVGDLR